MLKNLPATTEELLAWDWPRYEPYIQEMSGRALTAANVTEFVQDWSSLSAYFMETYNRRYVASTLNTADKAAEQAFKDFMDLIFPNAMAAEQVFKEKLLASGLQPEGFEIPLRNMRAEADLFRQENLPLLGEEQKLAQEYQHIIGGQTVQWEGKEVTVTQLRPVFFETDRALREKAWRLAAERQLADRQAINTLWGRLLELRLKIAANAGKPDYRAYRWQQQLRFDYTPADCRAFHDAIEKAVVPAARRIYARRQQALGLSSLRPWDLNVDPLGRAPLKPFKDSGELIAKTHTIFQRVDPQLGEHFGTMIREGLLDVENRKNKAPGAYCTDYSVIRRPFIFENAVGLHDDVQTLLHEGGHAMHVFESTPIPYMQQLNVPMEFAEVASMGMELLAAPYLETRYGGFYTPAEAARARIEHLESSILFWPYMAVVDAFQHWVYENPTAAQNPAECDAAWAREWGRFMVGVDYSGFENVLVTGWHRKLHIHEVPFYYVEYGLAQLGAVQVWRNALKDQPGAVAKYRKALALGGTVTLPELFQTAGARLAFDAGTLGEAVALMESKIEELEKIQ